ncbi:hypothetical protein [Chryseobacterium taiwanense]|uniref:Lipoprotein n=1 Tax=Chryseobacterium taiwanense TaxID=363331 RepID=A0A0B4EAP7_9FLAO|nr:hypothetical protein [Chryseobacterium taiwanense]KIC63698.1 hypothetical protein RM51_08565 [Chryseobacterium taiwanense]
MNRKTFLKTSLNGLVYTSLSMSLLSCLNDDHFETETNDKNTERSKKRFKPIYIISEGGDVVGKKTKSIEYDKRKKVLMNFVSLGYITENISISETNKTNNKLKIIKLNHRFSCVLFNDPLEISLPNTFRKLKFKYINYNDITENFTNKEIIF